MDKQIPKNPILFGIFISKKHSKWVIIALLSVLIATGLDRFSVVVLKNLTDAITTAPISTEVIWFWALFYPALTFVGRLAWRSSGFSGMRWFMNFRSSAYQDLYEYLTLHSKDYFNNRFAGALVNKISNAVDGAQFLLDRVLWKFIPLVIGLFWYIAISWLSDFRLGLILFIWSFLFLGINILFARRLQPYSYKSSNSISILKGKIVDSLSNISLVHEYAYVGGERDYIKKYVTKSKILGLKSWSYSEWILFINGIFLLIFDLAMIVTAISLFEKGQISLGVVIMVIAIVSNLSGNFIFIAQEMKDTAGNFGQAKEGLSEILTEHVIKDDPDARDFKFSKGAISLESINFEYDNKKVFENFSISIPAGQKVGLVGHSGAGKTTFVSLLLRHFDVQSGVIKIDGQDISQVTLESLRRAIAFVPQDTSLFHRTIGENISYSNPKASEEKIKLAAKQAQADEFIMSLPKGYETLVGERGVKLSGGQRQRVSIARAFLKDSPILVLDEATSSLDSASESLIQESLEELMRGRTVIAIAHRLSTLKKMDRIVIIEEGKILEDGNPEELLRNEKGVFREMWDHQVSGFIVD